MKRMSFFFIIFALGLIFSPALAQDSSEPSFIAFVATRGGNEDIYITTLDNRLTYNLTNARSRDWHPTWSPDGTRIAFVSDRDGNQEIYVMSANGSEQTNATQNAALDTSPDWSPVADEIVFVSNRDGGYDLYVLTLDSGEVRRITTNQQPKSDPDWSPDGAHVVYWEQSGNNTLLKIVNVADGVTHTVVEEGQNLWPAWSPQGDSILYHTPRSVGTAVINRVRLGENFTAAEIITLTNGAAEDIRGDWSPDGERIVFARGGDGTHHLYIMNPDGSGQRQLTASSESESSPAWQPRPATLDFSNTAFGLSAMVATSAIDAALQTDLGPATAKAFGPEIASVRDVIRIRLELTLDSAENNTSGETDGLVMRSSEDVSAHLYMGARLTGTALSRFDVTPGNLEYVQKIKADEVNAWEWLLQPRGAESLGNNLLAIELYLPEAEIDGVSMREIITTQAVYFEVVNGRPTQTSEFVQNTIFPDPEYDIRVQYESGDYLAIIFEKETDITGISIAANQAFMLAEEFSVAASSGKVAGMTCLYFVRAGTTPTLPRACQTPNSFASLLSGSDIFWHSNQRGLNDVMLNIGGRVLACSYVTAVGGCRF